MKESVVVLCLTLWTKLISSQAPDSSSDWIFVSPGDSVDFKRSAFFGLLQPYNRWQFYTGNANQLKLKCSMRLPCLTRSYIKAINNKEEVFAWYCSSVTSYASVPELTSTHFMKLELNSGLALFPDYECQISSVPATGTVTARPPTECECGTISGTRIVGGSPVAKGTIPWQVALGSVLFSHFHSICGGTLISPKYVITAAHCIANTQTSYNVLLGDVDLKLTSSVVAGIANIQRHESYDLPALLNNDIAILTLDRSVPLNAYVYPACLPRKFTSETFDGKDLLVSGWGVLKEGDTTPPTILRAVSVKGVSNPVCSQKLGNITSGMLCAGSPGKDPCYGDSGGPLTYTQSSVTYVVGVVSFSEGCAKPNYPAVYTRITSFLTWIDSKTGGPLCSK